MDSKIVTDALFPEGIEVIYYPENIDIKKPENKEYRILCFNFPNGVISVYLNYKQLVDLHNKLSKLNPMQFKDEQINQLRMKRDVLFAEADKLDDRINILENEKKDLNLE